MRVILGYIAWSESARLWHEDLVRRARGFGWDVEAFCLTPGNPSPRYTFIELDNRWKARDAEVVALYRRLKAKVAGADVFWNFNGANVHPEWLQEFECLNVYGCFDDPESSQEISRPVAVYADTCLIGNLACGPMYEGWGVRHHAWAPLAFVGEDYDPQITPEMVEKLERTVPVMFMGERQSPYRTGRLDVLAHAFPEAVFYGSGWPAGYVSVEERRKIYRQARIGWNIHNSVGPVNLRFFALLANGVLQICDNKCRSGQVVKLGEEIIGFDTIEECIELTRYYLNNDEERRRIAANGLRKYQAEFTEEKIWNYYFEKFNDWFARRDIIKSKTTIYLPDIPKKYFDFSGSLFSTFGKTLSNFGLELHRKTLDIHQNTSQSVLPYVENPEAGGINFAEKIKRQESGGLFEWPNMVALNWACTQLVGDAKQIIELGGGTGCFAFEASAVSSRVITCIDTDAEAIAWAKTNRSRENIRYLAKKSADDLGSFDVVVAIDVIEHLSDFAGFLRNCCQLAPRAIFTTPNKCRAGAGNTVGPPSYYQHVREWNAGEFYWVLKSFYQNVTLYSMPDSHVPLLCTIDVVSPLIPLIATCSEPLEKNKL